MARVAKVIKSTKSVPPARKPARVKRQGREIGSGEAVPPGAAVPQPAPLDEEAETGLENLEEHLGHE